MIDIQLKSTQPIEFANALKALQPRYSNKTTLAVAVGVSSAEVTRYLKLLELPNELKAGLENGEISVNKALTLCSRSNVSKQVSLSKNAKKALGLLHEFEFLTMKQLSTLLNLTHSAVVKLKQSLINSKYIQIYTAATPFAIRLSASYYKKLGISVRGWKSAAAIHNILVRNSIYIEMKRTNSSVKLLHRVFLWNKGFYPAVGEYCFSYVHPDRSEREYALILVDDYDMNVSRSYNSYTRIHHPPKQYYQGQSLTWADLVSLMLVYTTNDNKVRHFNRYIQRKPFDISCSVRSIDSIWDAV